MFKISELDHWSVTSFARTLHVRQRKEIKKEMRGERERERERERENVAVNVNRRV